MTTETTHFDANGAFYYKDPQATLDYIFDLTTNGWLAVGETIMNDGTNVVTVTGGGTLVTKVVNPTNVIAWVSGGTPGGTILVACYVETSAGRKDSRSIRLKVLVR